MHIRFDAARPQGAFALAVPVSGAGGSDPRLPAGSAPLVAAALRQQRFEGEAQAVAEMFLPDDGGARRTLLIGMGGGTPDASAL